jgi:peptidyl-prolyl cis-trans isomerase B (cyclophilin B)
MPILAAALLLVTQTSTYNPSGPKIEVDLPRHRSFVITTDPKSSPQTVKAILALVKSGFYDGQKFHRVESWVVQWGDPQSKTLPIGDSRLGSKGSGHALPFEGSDTSFMRGVVGIASTGTRVGGDSQIFVLTRSATHLTGSYAVLGKVTAGMAVVDKIVKGDKIVKVRVLGRG